MFRFEFIIEGPPVSQQTRRRERLKEWKATVRQAAEHYWSSQLAITAEDLMLQVTYFYDETAMDVDNIVKPIQDALINLVYFDDSQITDVLVRKRPLFGDYRSDRLTPILIDGLICAREFLHILITDAPTQEGLL